MRGRGCGRVRECQYVCRGGGSREQSKRRDTGEETQAAGDERRTRGTKTRGKRDTQAQVSPIYFACTRVYPPFTQDSGAGRASLLFLRTDRRAFIIVFFLRRVFQLSLVCIYASQSIQTARNSSKKLGNDGLGAPQSGDTCPLSLPSDPPFWPLGALFRLLWASWTDASSTAMKASTIAQTRERIRPPLWPVGAVARRFEQET